MVVGVEVELVWLEERWAEVEEAAWAPGLDLWEHQAGSLQEALEGKGAEWLVVLNILWQFNC